MSETATSNSNGGSKTGLYTREAKMPDEFEGVLECAVRSFNTDPCFMYFGSVTELTPQGLKPENEKGLRAFMTFIIKTCIDMDAKFTIVVDPTAKGIADGKERIAAVIYWVPPNQRIALYQFSRLLRGGIWGVLSNWGLGCVDVSHFLSCCQLLYPHCHRELRRSTSTDVTTPSKLRSRNAA